MKTMNNIYEAPKAEVIEMNLTGAVLIGSNGTVNPSPGPEGSDNF